MDHDYLLLFRGGSPRTAGLSPSELQAYMHKWIGWMDDMKEADIYVTGRPLELEGGAFVAGDRVQSDGPFVESREVIGGYIAIRVPDLDTAIAWAKRCPIHQLDGRVEVRTMTQDGSLCTDMEALAEQVAAEKARQS